MVTINLFGNFTDLSSGVVAGITVAGIFVFILVLAGGVCILRYNTCTCPHLHRLNYFMSMDKTSHMIVDLDFQRWPLTKI